MVVVKCLLDDFLGCNVDRKRFYEATFSSKIPTLFAPSDCWHIKKTNVEMFPCAKDDPECNWLMCSSLVLIGCLTKWPFSVHSDVMESHTLQLILCSVCLLSEPRTIIPSSEATVGWESVASSPSLPSSLPFFFSPCRVSSKSHLFAFSYAMVRGLITSWQETSHQRETFFLWQLLSNCCPRTATPPPSLPSAPH